MRWIGVAVFFLLAGCASEPFTSPRETPRERVVQLCYADLAGGLGVIANHYWFNVYEPREQCWHRYEVWPKQNVGGSRANKHVVVDLLAPNECFGGGPPVVQKEWHGEDAEALAKSLDESLERYPHLDNYVVWPGPNSNTYAAWILDDALVGADMHPMGVGKDYVGIFGCGAWITPSCTGVHLETPLVGVAIGAREGIELHFLCLTLGIDLWPPALKTPFARLGFPEPDRPQPSRSARFVWIECENGERGVVVTKVDKGSRAEEAGVKPGAVIVAIEGRKVSSADELDELGRGPLAATVLEHGGKLELGDGEHLVKAQAPR